MEQTQIQARDFSQEEINEVNRYIASNVPYTILGTLYILTENYEQKAKAFTTIYRIINGSKNYAENPATREKLERLLKECKTEYEELYKCLILKEVSGVHYGTHILKKQISLVFSDYERNARINKMIDFFLVFAEKLVLLETDKVAGLELETDEGKTMYKKLMNPEYGLQSKDDLISNEAEAYSETDERIADEFGKYLPQTAEEVTGEKEEKKEEPYSDIDESIDEEDPNTQDEER